VTALRVLVAPDSFKGSLPATEVARAIANGWSSVRPTDAVTILPLADGGEGTLDAIEASVPGSERRDAGPVAGPDGRPVRGEWLWLPDGTGVVELAQMCGLPLMLSPDALGSTTVGLGQVIRAAIDAGAKRLVIGLGGSASTDGGAGALAALGLIAVGGSLARGGAALKTIGTIDRSQLLPPPVGGVILLADVEAPLLGEAGAAALFGPQKGATGAEVSQLDAALSMFASRLGGAPGAPGAGAAGGAAYGFTAAWDAEICSGADYVAQVAGLASLARRADVVLTGEGRFDATSLGGKLVGRVIRTSANGSTRIGVIAGVVAMTPHTPDGTEIWSLALVDLSGSTESAMTEAVTWLRCAGATAATEFGAA
jgi:glycerate kinase